MLETLTTTLLSFSVGLIDVAWAAHLGVPPANALATLVLAPPLLPEPGTVDPDVEAMARMRNPPPVCTYLMGELIELVNSFHDSSDQLVVVSNLRSSNKPTVALRVKYEAYTIGPVTAEPAMI